MNNTEGGTPKDDLELRSKELENSASLVDDWADDEEDSGIVDLSGKTIDSKKTVGADGKTIQTEEEDDIPFVEPEDIKNNNGVEATEEEEVVEEEEDANEEDVDGEEDDSEFIEPFIDLFSAELGWELTDEEKPKSAKELVDFIQDIIETNSIPQFASDEISELNEFVRNGGDLKHYFEATSNSLDLESDELGSESRQKQLVTANLKTKGYSDDRVNKLIKRYEDAGTLEDEASDALELLREHQEVSKANLLKAQEQQRADELKQQREFMSNVQKTISDTTSIRGISLTDKDKAELMDALFKPIDKTGVTKYQKEFNKNIIKNLLESAFLTIKGDLFESSMSKTAKTAAVRDFKAKLRSKGSNVKTSKDLTITESDGFESWDLLSKSITG